MVLGVLGTSYVLLKWKSDTENEGSSFQIFLVFWAGVSLVLLALIGGKEAGQILSPLLPLTLLAGSLIGELARRLDSRSLHQAILPQRRESIALAVIAPLLGLGLIYSIHTTWSVSYKPGAMEWLHPCVTSPQAIQTAPAR